MHEKGSIINNSDSDQVSGRWFFRLSALSLFFVWFQQSRHASLSWRGSKCKKQPKRSLVNILINEAGVCPRRDLGWNRPPFLRSDWKLKVHCLPCVVLALDLWLYLCNKMHHAGERSWRRLILGDQKCTAVAGLDFNQAQVERRISSMRNPHFSYFYSSRSTACTAASPSPAPNTEMCSSIPEAHLSHCLCFC